MAAIVGLAHQIAAERDVDIMLDQWGIQLKTAKLSKPKYNS